MGLTFKKVPHLFSVIIVVGLLLGSCTCFERRLLVNNIIVDVPKNLPSSLFDAANIQEILVGLLNEDQTFRYSHGDKGKTLRMGILADIKAQPQSVFLFADVVDLEKNRVVIDKAYASLSLSPQADLYTELKNATALVLKRLKELARNSDDHDEQYLLLISSAAKSKINDSAELLLAISVVAENDLCQAENDLLSILQNSTNPTIQSACVIALGEFRSAKAVPLIIEFAARKNSNAKKQAIEAMRKIGNQEAMEWLLVLSEGHLDPEVRHLAQEAYQEIADKLDGASAHHSS